MWQVTWATWSKPRAPRERWSRTEREARAFYKALWERPSTESASIRSMPKFVLSRRVRRRWVIVRLCETRDEARAAARRRRARGELVRWRKA